MRWKVPVLRMRWQPLACTRGRTHPTPSVTRDLRRTPTMKPALAALTIAVAGCTGSQAPGDLSAEPRITVSGAWLHFTGPITPASVDAVGKALAGGRWTGLSIDSEGGDVEAAMAIARLVQDHRLDVEVRHWCMSSCANYIFPSGARKVIAEGAVVGWHGSVAHLHFLDTMGRGSSDTAVRAHHAALALREAAFLRAAGVDPFVTWFGKLDPYNVPNFFALTVEDMRVFGITNVVAPAAYGPGYLATLPEGMRRGIVFIGVDAEVVRASRPPWLP